MAAPKSQTDFEDCDAADILREDARIDEIEHAYDTTRRAAEAEAFQQKALAHAVSYCLGSCLDCLDLLYIAREHHPITDVAQAHNSWCQEAEPEPCGRDSWLRGIVPEMPAPPVPPASQQQQQLLAQPRQLKERPPSALSKKSGGPGSVKSVKSVRAPSLAQSVKSLGPVRPATEQAASTGGGSGSMQQQQPGQQGSAAAATSTSNRSNHTQQQDAEDRLRQELHLRCQQEAVSRQLRQKDEQARAALQALQKQLKGTDYTYDSKGQVVLLARINPDTLPAPPGPQFKVHTPADAAAAAAAEAAAAAAAAKKSSSRSLGAHRTTSVADGKLTHSSKTAAKAAAAAAAAREFVPTTTNTQPPLLETLKPAAGVTVRAGAAAKLGPKRDPTGQQTRAQYQQQAKAQNQQPTRIVAAAKTSPPGLTPATASTSGRSTSANSAAAAGGGSSSSSGGGGGSTGGGAEAGLAHSGSSCQAADTASPAVREADTSSNSQSLAPGPSVAAATALGSTWDGLLLSSNMMQHAGSLNGGPGAAAAAPPAQQRLPDMNLMLVAAADWGVAGNCSGYAPPEPCNPGHASTRQIQEEFGRTTHLPKLRAPVATLKPPRGQPSPTAVSKLSGSGML